MPMKLTDEAKVGIVVGLAIALFIAGMIFFGGFHLRKSGYILKIHFLNTTGLEKGDPITLSGVKVGRVRKMALENGKVIVTVWVDSEFRFPRDSSMSIRTLTLMGDKYIDVRPGTDTEVFRGGETIEGAEESDMMSLAASVEPTLERLTRVLGRAGALLDAGAERDIKAGLSNIHEITETLKETLPNHSHDLRTLVDKLQTIATDVGEITGTRKERINAVIDRIEGTSVVLDETAVHLRESSDSLSDILRRTRSGEGTLGRLITDEGLYKHLDSLVVNLDELVRDFKTHPKKYIHLEIF